MATPRVVTNSFVPDLPAPVAGIQLRPVNVITSLLLEKIESPLVVTRAPDSTPPDAIDSLRAIYLMSRSDEELLSYFAGFSRDQFEKDVLAFALATPASAIKGLVETMLHLTDLSTATLIGRDVDPEEEDAGAKKKPRGKKSPAKTASPTASAGS